MTCSIRRAPSSMSSTAIGNGATNGAGIVWFTTKVCTVPVRRDRDRFELRSAARDARRVDRRRGADRPAVDAAAAEEPEHLVRAAHEHRALGWDAHRDRLARRDELTARAQRLGVGDRRAVGERVHHERGAGDRRLDVDEDAAWCGHRRVPTIATMPGASSAPIAPSNGAAAPVSPTAAYTAVDAGAPPPTSFATVAPSRPSGSGSDHARTSNDASARRDLGDDGQEDLLAEQATVVEVAHVVLAVAAVAVEERPAARDARAEGGGAAAGARARSRPRPRRSALRSRCRGRGGGRRRR